MATIKLTWISAFVIILLIRRSGSEDQDILKFNLVTNKFAWNLYKGLNHFSGNTIVSPFSLQLLLDALLQCANGTTAAEISRVLQHEAEDKSILNAYKHFLELQHDLNVNEMSKFKTAATIALDQSFPLSEGNRIDHIITEYFKTKLMRYNFKERPENSRIRINAWVYDYTEGEIRELLREGSIDSTTEVVMVSGTVFKGKWKQVFDISNTRIESFYITPKVAVNVTMMAITGSRFRYAWNSDFAVQILELPYTDEDFRMVVILPDNVTLAELETKLTYEKLIELINSVRETEIDIFLPRFRINRTIMLTNVLKKMGMHTAFTPYADFSKMTNSSISVTSIIQKAKIVVNEKGTRVAAASDVAISAASLPPQMVCNSPFMYLILKGNTILFIGNFIKP